MVNLKRIAALQFIQKAHQYEIDRLGNSLGILRNEMAILQAKLDGLQAGLDQETHSVSTEAAPYLAGYLRAVKQQQGFYRLQMAALLAQCNTVETELFERFCRAKTDESPLKKALSENRLDRAQKETQLNDEVGVTAYHRRQLSQ
jgi:hypothetical protein